MNKLDQPITLDEATARITAVAGDDDDVCIVRMVLHSTEVMDVAVGAMEVLHAPLQSAINLIKDDDIVEACWTTHELFGECLVLIHQCASHPENPLDRESFYFTTVRKP